MTETTVQVHTEGREKEDREGRDITERREGERVEGRMEEQKEKCYSLARICSTRFVNRKSASITYM